MTYVIWNIWMPFIFYTHAADQPTRHVWMNENLFLACFSAAKSFFSIFCIWIFSTMKDPNIGQRGLRLKLWYWSSSLGRIIQHRGKSCRVYLAVATGQFWNACTQFEIVQNHPYEIYFSAFMHLKFHLYSFLSADTMYTFGSAKCPSSLSR